MIGKKAMVTVGDCARAGQDQTKSYAIMKASIAKVLSSFDLIPNIALFGG